MLSFMPGWGVCLCFQIFNGAMELQVIFKCVSCSSTGDGSSVSYSVKGFIKSIIKVELKTLNFICNCSNKKVKPN